MHIDIPRSKSEALNYKNELETTTTVNSYTNEIKGANAKENEKN